MRKPFAMGMAFFLFPILLHATPDFIQVGSFSINNYAGNGSGMPNFDYMNGYAQNLYFAAIGKVADAALHPGITLTDAQVTKAAITDTTRGFGAHREEASFVIYGGHGDHGSLFLGLKSGYGYVYPAELKLGKFQTRWFWSQSCLAFSQPGTPVSAWTDAFRGLRAMLGYASAAYDYSNSITVLNKFWSSWITGGRNLFLAFVDSQQEFYYQTGKGSEVACISATTGNPVDYCLQSYAQADTNRASNGAQIYYRQTIGTPTYGN